MPMPAARWVCMPCPDALQDKGTEGFTALKGAAVGTEPQHCWMHVGTPLFLLFLPQKEARKGSADALRASIECHLENDFIPRFPSLLRTSPKQQTHQRALRLPDCSLLSEEEKEPVRASRHPQHPEAELHPEAHGGSTAYSPARRLRLDRSRAVRFQTLSASCERRHRSVCAEGSLCAGAGGGIQRISPLGGEESASRFGPARRSSAGTRRSQPEQEGRGSLSVSQQRQDFARSAQAERRTEPSRPGTSELGAPPRHGPGMAPRA